MIREVKQAEPKPTRFIDLKPGAWFKLSDKPVETIYMKVEETSTAKIGTNLVNTVSIHSPFGDVGKMFWHPAESVIVPLVVDVILKR